MRTELSLRKPVIGRICASRAVQPKPDPAQQRRPAGHGGLAAASNASLAAIPNVTLLEAPWANREAETDVCWPYPEIEDGYALPLEGPGLGIEADETSVDEKLAASKPFVPSLPGPRLRGQAEWAGWVGAGFLTHTSRLAGIVE